MPDLAIIASMATNLITVVVVLYVRGEIRPLANSISTHEKLLENRRLGETKLHDRIDETERACSDRNAEVRERVARCEAGVESLDKKVCS